MLIAKEERMSYKRSRLKSRWFIILILFALTGPSGSLLARQAIQGLRIWTSPENTRVVFDLTGNIKYQLFTLENPHRVVIDVEEALFKTSQDPKNLVNSKITNIRHSLQNDGKLRVVLDMDQKSKPTSFLLAPNAPYGHRLVVDLGFTPQQTTKTMHTSGTPKVDFSQVLTRDFIVAIDPGHGGEDAGAINRDTGLREKDVALSVSKKLMSLINAQPGMRAFLVRTGDYYVGLRNRMTIARDHGADLFISIHADSFKDPRASGAAVFVLSEKGASSEAARWLAESENRADLIGGVSLDNKSGILASVLLDLSQTASKSASQELGTHLIQQLGKVTDLHHETVQHAGFMVLKSPDIPSVLVELGFISNKKGEKALASPSHQMVLARALLSGVKTYVAKKPPPIKNPDNWDIAKQSSPGVKGNMPQTKVSVQKSYSSKARG